MAFAPDPAGVLDSDAHRVVLAHLSRPDDEYAWNDQALLARVAPAITSADDLAVLLADLKGAQLAKSNSGKGWQMSAKGLAVLTGPIKDEPLEGAQVNGPAVVTAATPLPKAA